MSAAKANPKTKNAVPLVSGPEVKAKAMFLVVQFSTKCSSIIKVEVDVSENRYVEDNEKSSKMEPLRGSSVPSGV